MSGTIAGPDGLWRAPPLLPAGAMKSYTVAAPLATHWRPATCAEAECGAFVNGWVTVVPADSPAAEYIRHDKTRSWREERRDGGLAAFTFPPGQQAFASREHEHRIPTGRPERFIVRGGDWRGNPRGDFYEHARPDEWVEDFALHQDRIATAFQGAPSPPPLSPALEAARKDPEPVLANTPFRAEPAVLPRGRQ